MIERKIDSMGMREELEKEESKQQERKSGGEAESAAAGATSLRPWHRGRAGDEQR